MPTVVIIPVKSFRLGKQRLSDTYDEATRARLGRALAEHVASTVESTGLIPLIVTADAEVAEWATMDGFPSLPESSEGLDAAARTGVSWALETGSRWIVLHGDLPLLRGDDVTALDRGLQDGSSVIAPSSDGGTSAIGSHRELEFSFGASSFHRHLRIAHSPMVIVRTGLALDLDAPDDLRTALAHPDGQWLARVL